MSGESSGVNPLVAIRYLNASPTNRDSSGVASPLASLAAGTEIEGFVINRTSNLQPILRTAIGDILVDSELFLKTGSEVVIRVDPNVAGRARIVKVDGLPPQQYAQQTGHQSAAATTNISSAATAASATQTTGSAPVQPAAPPPNIIQALFVPSSSAHPTASLPPHILSPTVQLPSGQSFSPQSEWVGELRTLLQQRPSLEVQILARALPNSPINAFANIPPLPTPPANVPLTSQAAAPTPTPQPSAPPTAGVTPPNIPAGTTPPTPPATNSTAPSAPISPAPSATTPSAPIAQPTTTTTSNPNLASTTAPPAASQHVAASTPPPAASGTPPVQLQQTQNAPTITPAALDKALTGTVVRAESNKPLIVQTAVGQFQLTNVRPIPAGSTILFTLSLPDGQPSSPIASAPLLPPTLASVAPLMQEWETLEEIVKLMQSAYPQAAQTLLERLPQPGPKLANAMLFLLNALKGGSVRELLGNAAHEPLETQHSHLLKKLSTEWGSMQQVSREPVSQEWSMLLLPMWNDEQLDQMRLFIREDGHHGSEHGENTQRFIVEVSLSALGEMQLDGFVHGEKPNLQFDIMVRTEQKWPDTLQTSLKGLFTHTLETLGMKGSLNTQTGRQYFIRPLTTEGTAPSHHPSNTDGVIA